VLDGAILVLCAVGGVQSQSITVDQQMKRYKVPCIAFINKCDRSGADPFRVIAQLRSKLGHNAVAMQIPIGLEIDSRGIVDLVAMKALYFDGDNGEVLRTEEIPENLLAEAKTKREELIDAASMFSDELTEAILEERNIPEDLILTAVRKGALKRELTPVFMGSAYKNKGFSPFSMQSTDCSPAPPTYRTRHWTETITRRRSFSPVTPVNPSWLWPSNWKTAPTVSSRTSAYIKVIYRGE